MYICGDWNARLIYPTSTEEKEIIGKHTMHEDDSVMNLFTAGMNDNRERIIELAKTYNLIAMNTRFRKRLGKNVIYRKIKETDGISTEPITKETHEQLDYWLILNRWKNSIKNMESDTKANIDSGHYPVIGTFETKLRGISTLGKHRSRYEKCTEEENNNTNQALTENTTDNTKEWLSTGAKTLPKEKPRDRFRKSQLSLNTLGIVGERGRARKERNLEDSQNSQKNMRKVDKKTGEHKY